MFIVHHVSRDELDRLFAAVAKPRQVEDSIDWQAPAWWYAMLASARS